MTWTRFMDMHSGGGRKLAFEYVYIEAAEDEAVRIFEADLDRDPRNVTCRCCGGDYSFNEEDSLEEATQYDRHDATIEEWLASPDVKVIRAGEVKP